jgi:hypothetical protein
LAAQSGETSSDREYRLWKRNTGVEAEYRGSY